jgi:hypothetical protein
VFSIRTYYDAMLSFIPCAVTEVVQFREGQHPHILLSTSHANPRSQPLLAWIKYLFANFSSTPHNWNSAFPHTMMIDPEGMFLIRTWNSYESRMEHFFLNAKHLSKALSTKNVTTMWAFSDHGLAFLLSEYMECMKDNMGDIFDLQIPIREHDNTAWKDVTHELQPFIKCMQLRENATADMIATLYHYLYPMVHIDEHKVRVVDFDLETKDVEGDAYIFV